ncbi:MAG: DNA polymerase III subunit delta [Bacilli bacterium]|nr:DNA polymerase III subunit delta [Bacilli bacterium]
MIYVLYGLEKFLIEAEVEKIIKTNNIDQFSISKYSAKQTNLDDVFFDVDSMSLFGNKRVIIVDDAYFFTGEKASDDKALDKIEKFLTSFATNNIVIFIINSEKMDERKKITKLVKKVGQVKEFNAKTDANLMINSLLSEYKISAANINLIKKRINNKLEVVNNEIEKLIIYKGSEKEIAEEDIYNVISEYPNIDFFEFIDDIINKKIPEALKTYQELLKLKEEPIKIIVTLANQFRLMYQAKKLFQSGYLERDIVSETGEHPYRVKLAISKAQKYRDEDLIDLLKKLGEINLNIKKGLVDSKTSLELFILDL